MKSEREHNAISLLWKNWYKLSRISFLLMLPVISACDPEHRDKCEWYLEADYQRVETVEPGWVALCATNRVINKQRCYLKAELDYAKALQGKPFRLNSLKFKQTEGYPQEIISVKVCKNDP